MVGKKVSAYFSSKMRSKVRCLSRFSIVQLTKKFTLKGVEAL